MSEVCISTIENRVATLYRQTNQRAGRNDSQSAHTVNTAGEGPFPDDLCQRIAEQFGITITPEEWAGLGTIPQLARLVESKRLAYWRSRLADVPAFPPLPIEQPGLSADSDAHRREVLSLPEELQRQVDDWTGGSREQLFSVLLAVYSLLLHRYTEQNRLVVITPHFYLCSDYAERSSFIDYLSTVAEQAGAARERADITVQQLCTIEQQAAGGDEHQRPIMFRLLEEEAFHQEDTAIPSVKLCLDIARLKGGLAAKISYDPALFERDAIVRMLLHYRTLLEAVVQRPDQVISALPLITAAERKRLLVDWNDTAADYPREKQLHRLIEDQVEQTPDLTAVVSEGERLSYRELNRKANQLAHHLRKSGVGRGQPVGVCVSRSTGAIVAMLGVWKANGVYVPLDPSYPTDRLGYMLEHAGIQVLISESNLLARMPHATAHAILLDRDWPGIEQGTAENPSGEGTAEDLAYMMYTSGSTGRPKGACCKHVGVVNLLADLNRRMPLNAGDGCSLWTSFSFDVSIFETLSALSAGGTLHIVPDNRVRYDSSRLFQWMSERQIKSAYVPPFMLTEMSEWLAKPDSILSLTRLAVGVEPIWEPTLAAIADHIPGVAIYNIYGPSEATIYCTTYLFDRAKSGERHFPIGRPIANTRIYLLDAHRNPVPVGIPGELYIAGDGLGAGYWNNPTLTAERFLPDPFDPQPDALMYRTGDRARYLPDGNIQFLGRIDFQLKIRGHRVEPGEIEAVLTRHPQVRQAVVVPVEDRDQRTQLAAFLVATSPTLEAKTIQSYLQQRLPSYMIPSTIRLLEDFPLNPNGKLDRKALIAQVSANGG
ncbi:amino acid adenylation domain-containing protein [Brevibacillus humidisoli]|uniref:non-ribosomal peptide synthetase n=1 Tax=Brevibacillus humidisoli TaxID=2895522 RepID=UPI001E3C7399|nr:amino acid adenylation domain-containing protein [Brevibacillus humidisoli]UFJ42391.1 amino acid adenylation domain-containing protein [Brevibacillus humidisoli]